MRTIRWITMMVLAVALLTASKEKPKVLEQGSMLYINVKQNGMRVIENENKQDYNDGQVRYTPKQVVENAGNFTCNTIDGLIDSPLGIAEEQRDVENERIKMWGEQVIDKHGQLVDYFIGARDIRIMQGRLPEEGGNFVIAYIPNKVMIEAEAKIKQAYNAGNYDEVYRLFHEAYTAIPITHKEWEALKAKGEQ